MASPTVLITGAARGLGQGLVSEFIRRHWLVFPLVRRVEDARSLTDRHPESCIPIVADVCEDRLEARISNALAAHTSHLDLLVNNAGIVRKKRGLHDTSPEDVLEHVNVHCVGVLRCVKATLPFLRRAHEPRVINITSRWSSLALTAAGQGWPAAGPLYAYKIAKCAQNMLTVCLDRELAREGIRVLAVHPGRIKTEVAALDADLEVPEAATMLCDWIVSHARIANCALHDVTDDSTIDW